MLNLISSSPNKDDLGRSLKVVFDQLESNLNNQLSVTITFLSKLPTDICHEGEATVQ